MLQSIGMDYSQDAVVALLGPDSISPAQGLHRGSGDDLVRILHNLGLKALNNWLDFDQVAALAGHYPIAIGGLAWYHWSGVRGYQDQALLLANPSPGWGNIRDVMRRAQFNDLGPFAAVWIIP